ncbi:MAG: circadian clock protein KaiC, partial [Candidatus Sumerlaeia bacterium]|nr:circadian clock protein KaiC [Candidatus Sumerlaeia bacterium]
EGGAGSGKTLFALQTLVGGAIIGGEPGIFVAFEENSRQILSNAREFGWDLPSLEKEKLFFLNAQPSSKLIQAGAFALGGMLAALGGKVKEMGARRIVFDALDVVLALLGNDTRAIRREVYALHDWLLENQLTAIITHKRPASGEVTMASSLGFLQFMVDCSIGLNHEIVDGVSHRNLRILKYRGSGFEENKCPFVIDRDGFEVSHSIWEDSPGQVVSEERISSGIDRLDKMLGGGYYRGAGVLITGSPGTAKTTLCGAFARAACERGEKTLFVSFDSRQGEIVRNLKSVGIDFTRDIAEGRLAIVSKRANSGSAEIHLMEIKKLARQMKVDCLLVDPVSALSLGGNVGLAHNVVERLVDWGKLSGITLVCTSLLDHAKSNAETTPLMISTIADTWIHLSYVINAGERNRALSIIKSRGTSHSNQVRELRLSRDEITLEDVYMAGGEVLMGAMRYEKEQEEKSHRKAVAEDFHRRRKVLLTEISKMEASLAGLQAELNFRREEASAIDSELKEEGLDWDQSQEGLRSMRLEGKSDGIGGETR